MKNWLSKTFLDMSNQSSILLGFLNCRWEYSYKYSASLFPQRKYSLAVFLQTNSESTAVWNSLFSYTAI